MAEIRVVPMHVSDVWIPEGDPRAGAPFPVVAHAVIHRDGVLLFDTGVGTGNDEIEKAFSPRTTPIGDALTAHGIAIHDITAVANCHLHFDHGGQNARLPGIPIFAQRAEWRMVHEPDYTIAEWIDVPGLRYELLDGETEIAPGLRLVLTPGHTPGHQSLVVDAAEGAIVLAGQAVQSRAEWEGGTEEAISGEPSAWDREAYARSVERLRSFRPVRLHFAHDPAIWERGS